MPKCTICGEKAEYLVKGTSDYYCQECAEEYFADIKMLQTVEEQAKQIKKMIEEAGENLDEDEKIEEPVVN